MAHHDESTNASLNHMDATLATHSGAVRLRAELEYKMIAALISGLSASGFDLIGGNDGEEDQTFTSARVALEMAFSVDESQLYFQHRENATRHWVYLVMGNSGYDVISDYGCGTQAFADAVEASTADLVKRYA